VGQHTVIPLFVGYSVGDLKVKDSINPYKPAQGVIEDLIEDISNLLNTKPIYSFDENSQLKNFILNYGLMDLSAYSSYSKDDQKKVGEMIKECLLLFEPRLNEVSVVPIDKGENYGITLYFRITATLLFSDESILIVLESEVNKATNKIHLKLDAGG
jgi:type VI secretion system lysozyme-like protein